MSRNRLLLGLLCCLCVCFLACAKSETAEETKFLTFRDDAGEEITLTEAPERVAVLFSSLADIWVLAGGEVTVTVGESVERGIVPDGTLLVDDGAGKSISTELLLAAEVDFVICSYDIAAQRETAQLLTDIGIPAAQLRVESFADYLRVLELFTTITGNTEAYRQYGLAQKEEIDALLSACAAPAESKRILFIRAGSGMRSTKAKTADTHFAAAMLSELGAVNIADTAPMLIDGLSIEEILRQDPDCIFVSLMGDEDAARLHMESLFAEPVWQSLRAVQNGNCYYLPKELFQYKPNRDWYLAYALLANRLYEEKIG